MMKDLNMYSGPHSIYDAMKSWASSVYPSNNPNWESTSDNVCNILLNVMRGLPYNPGFALRIFNKFVACDMLYKHLTNNKVTIEQATFLYKNDRHIWQTCSMKALPEHK